ncbi:MAG: hypothetical protein VKK59_01060 [Vampirovibrionales bacterium]|nr:hypothetical protein [Vampirovibrionales bacterium]
MAQDHIAQIVTRRYLEECAKAGYQPVCHQASDVIESSMKALASLNYAVLISRSRAGTKTRTA